ncbi:hypothetical protein BD779DRAFT_1542100 [Infundibulicybe gibba]|nr:hypothetical protein BD779DRAFT_1542100 [Infundibulicybe gibba]
MHSLTRWSTTKLPPCWEYGPRYSSFISMRYWSTSSPQLACGTCSSPRTLSPSGTNFSSHPPTVNLTLRHWQDSNDPGKANYVHRRPRPFLESDSGSASGSRSDQPYGHHSLVCNVYLKLILELMYRLGSLHKLSSSQCSHCLPRNDSGE